MERTESRSLISLVKPPITDRSAFSRLSGLEDRGTGTRSIEKSIG